MFGFGKKDRYIRELETRNADLRRRVDNLYAENELLLIKLSQAKLNVEPKVPEATRISSKGSKISSFSRQDETPARKQDDMAYVAPAIVSSFDSSSYSDSSSSYSSCDSGSSGGDSGGSCGGGGE